MKVTTCVIAALLLTSCTVGTVRYGEFKMFIADLHPGGESIALEAVMDEVGSLAINRDTQDSAPVIGTVVDAAVGL